MAEVVLFPQTPVAKLRVQLRACDSMARLNSWQKSFFAMRDNLPHEDKITIVCEAAKRLVQIEQGLMA